MQWLTDLINRLLCIFPRIVLVHPDEMGLRISLGYCYKALEPGWYIYLPLLQFISKLPITPQVVDLKSQSLTTQDGKGIIISGAIEYSIRDITKAVLRVCNLDKSLPTLCLGKVAEYVETHDFIDCKSSAIKKELRREIREHVGDWGIQVHHIFLTDNITARSVRLFLDLPPIMVGETNAV